MPQNSKQADAENGRLTDMTLSQQLKITDLEIEERKALLEFTSEDVQALVAAKEIVAENIDKIVGAFYDKQIQIPEIQLLIGDAETFNRLHASMKRYTIELFEGYYDREYVNKRLRIGKVHKRIGVSPKLYLSAIHLLESVLGPYVTKAAMAQNACDHCASTQSALKKILTFDTQFVFDTYINSLVTEVASAKAQVENYAASLEGTIAERTKQLEEMSRKDVLTGLFNQRSFYEQLRREAAVAERNNQPISLVYFDLNGFKKLNDTQGHKAGDTLLALVGKAMREAVRDIDIGCRYGGDEFTIIMPNTEVAKAKAVCDRLIELFDGLETQGVSFSVGICQMGPEKYSDMDGFVKLADKRMYKAKAASKKEPGYHIAVDD